MAKVVTVTEVGGPEWSLSFPDVDDGTAIQDALEGAGPIEFYDVPTGQQGWRRPRL
jgi:hypothetical protein